VFKDNIKICRNVSIFVVDIFLLFWTIAIGFNSAAGLVVAAFSHAYIWAHFYATEKPDIDFLYSSR